MRGMKHGIEFSRFVIERHHVYLRREKGKAAPWTKDKILQTYRFCNVYRELDRVTQWIAENWRDPHHDYKHLWFAMVVARLINKPESLELLSLPGRWNKKQFLRILGERQESGEKVFSAAYIVSTNGRKMNKLEYLANEVLDPLWDARRELRPTKDDTLSEWHAALSQFQGLGSFMAAQVVADMKYVKPLKKAADWWTFAASGPGSRRGLNRVMGLPIKARFTEAEWRLRLRRLMKETRPIFKAAGLERLHAQDLQNCLCEFDKYERARLGEGRPKQKFTPHST